MSEEKEIVLSVNNNETVITTYANTLSDLLEEQSIESEDVTDSSVDLHSDLYDGQKVDVKVAFDYKVLVDGKTLDVALAAETVADVVSGAGVELSEYDIVEPALSTLAADDMVIDIHRVTIEEEIRETELAYSVETKKDSTIVSGDKIVVQSGKTGLRTDTYRVTYRDGELYDEELISTEVIDPVTEVVAVGTGTSVRPVVADKNSENESTASFSTAPNGRTCVKVLTCKATAYHSSDGSLTKSGTLPRVGIIAVDPSVIPLGTELYVEGYGYCVAEDTGGLIKGNRIDIYLDSDAECINWGVRNVTVYILE
ncbi:MAG: 3D domain-containing protein [Clostridia bacterium]